jgi:hypothetical protein
VQALGGHWLALRMFRQRYRKPRPVDVSEYWDSETVLLHDSADADDSDTSTVLLGPNGGVVEGISRRETSRKG